MLWDILSIIQDNWLLLLIGQYPNGPLGGFAATLILSVLSIASHSPSASCWRSPGCLARRSCSGRRLPLFTSRGACLC